MKLFVATGNPGKKREFRELLSSLDTDVLFPSDLGIEIDVKETGSTYADNAVIKVRAYATAHGRDDLITLADDSGLEVDALDGAPGVRSARYTPGSDTDRLQTLLSHLEGVPPDERSARFRCVVAIITPEGALHTAEGICEGVIATEAQGDGGFGYDPVFYIPEWGLTMAQLPEALKNEISHRARAVQAALPILRRLLSK